ELGGGFAEFLAALPVVAFAGEGALFGGGQDVVGVVVDGVEDPGDGFAGLVVGGAGGDEPICGVAQLFAGFFGGQVAGLAGGQDHAPQRREVRPGGLGDHVFDGAGDVFHGAGADPPVFEGEHPTVEDVHSVVVEPDAVGQGGCVGVAGSRRHRVLTGAGFVL